MGLTSLWLLPVPGSTSGSLTCNCDGCVRKAQLIEEKNPKNKITAILK